VNDQPLLDDPEFLAELDRLDAASSGSQRDARFAGYRRPTLDEWAREQHRDLPEGPPASEPHPTPAADRIVAAMTMVGGTLAGALLAAFVFHDEVSRILDMFGR
jgi:hypothetical protein